jgi:DNA-binding PadR family transcriptional regulator
VSSIRILVLGVVRVFQPVHGYDVRRELLSWHAEEWAHVQTGSIYNALKSLTRDGLLAVEGTGQVGGRPERTSYRLTAEGEEALVGMVRDASAHGSRSNSQRPGFMIPAGSTSRFAPSSKSTNP